MEFITREAVPWLRWLVAGFSLRCQANPCKICREKYGTRTGLHPRILVSFVVYTLGNDLVTFAETRKFAYRRCAKHAIIACYYFKSRSRWQRGLRCGSAAARLLGLLVQIPLSAWPSLSWECVLSGRVLCVGLITHSEDSYRVWCICHGEVSKNEKCPGPPATVVPWKNIILRSYRLV